MVSEYDRGAVPPHLLTRLQLREQGMSPGGQPIVGVLRCKACAFRPGYACIHPTRAWLLDIRLARPKRIPTLAQEWALDRAESARRTCPLCRRRYDHRLPLRRIGSCDPCARGYEPTPGTYIYEQPRPASSTPWH
ncbi:RRQRL motif-containing zinc-binding protein [Streptomyces sp. NPDC055955]|uniref:RRQRL motif-containing zinc-binding protein n=1 Tax=Streptomyces sp. NPDC055955 TaxID=3345665 RepID=UPI0035DC335D